MAEPPRGPWTCFADGTRLRITYGWYRLALSLCVLSKVNVMGTWKGLSVSWSDFGLNGGRTSTTSHDSAQDHNANTRHYQHCTSHRDHGTSVSCSILFSKATSRIW